ncbi:MAG: hypothetical protein A2297_07975 [Elusimicrobia bacterium RIFOXYB2_FULL_48_7]|nr:MAG: hypothetical protein A2297_07975 [Elusimicrobia bacterium RIFOXYB2_FULL_48_7]
MFKNIFKELKSHAPFTLFGAITGIAVMAVFKDMPSRTAYNIFYLLHPLHVFLSALVTASIYKFHSCERINAKCITGKCNLWVLLLIGYIGSIGIATLSDSIIPFLGETLLKLPDREIHVGFIEKWWLVNPLAFLGIAFAYFKPSTKFPHYGHVLISTWASLFHIIMAKGQEFSLLSYTAIFAFLFLSVWVPCCVSDFVFPLLFVRRK